MEKKEKSIMYFGLGAGVLIGIAISLIFYGISLPDNFDRKCTNPQFMGSEGIVDNPDLDRAFEESTPILGAEFRIYNKKDGNALWRCPDNAP